MTTILAFDIETVPDVQGIRTLYELPSSLPDDEVVLFAQQKTPCSDGWGFYAASSPSGCGNLVLHALGAR